MQKIQKYYSSPHISQSSLKDLAFHPSYYKAKHIDKTIPEEYGEDPEHFMIGSLAECILLTPEYLEQMYAIRTFELSPQLRTLADYVIKTKSDYSSPDLLLDYGKSMRLFGQIKNIDTFKALLEKENFDEAMYFYENNSDKSIVTSEQYDKATLIANSFLNNPFTRRYFEVEDGIELLTSLPIYWFYNKHACKSLLDFVRINHRNRTITINDLKTTKGYTADFNDAILQYRYDIQGAYYLDAFDWWVNNVRNDLKDYDVIGFSLFVESTKNIGNPLIFRLTEHDINLGRNGGNYIRNGLKKPLVGYKNLFENLDWHHEQNIWFCTKSQYENKGIINCNIETC